MDAIRDLCRRAWRWPLSRCVLCGARSDAARDLCDGCRMDLPRNDSCCARCALPLPRPVAMCGQCVQREPPWSSAWVPFRYAWPLNRLESRYKFSAALATGRVLAQSWCDFPPPAGVAAIVPVPLHRARLRRRGYDQGLELARQVAARMGVPLCADALYRDRATKAQSSLGAVARRRNVRGAFAVRDGAALPDHVALFDDVMTTGATFAECARVLRRAGVARVDVWALARVAPPALAAR